ncbi:hypothetical protein [Candidatus Mesenet endosymbiont of Agriotes lineatus]
MPAVKEKSNANIGCTKDLRLRMAEKNSEHKIKFAQNSIENS